MCGIVSRVSFHRNLSLWVKGFLCRLPLSEMDIFRFSSPYHSGLIMLKNSARTCKDERRSN